MPVWRWTDDTMQGHHVIDGEMPHGLAHIASVYTEIPYYKDAVKGAAFRKEFKEGSDSIHIVEQMVDAPRHPYTRGLLASTVHGGMRGQRLEAIPGAPPDLSEVPTACSFAARCKYAEARCLGAVPPLSVIGASHFVRCVVAA